MDIESLVTHQNDDTTIIEGHKIGYLPEKLLPNLKDYRGKINRFVFSSAEMMFKYGLQSLDLSIGSNTEMLYEFVKYPITGMANCGVENRCNVSGDVVIGTEEQRK